MCGGAQAHKPQASSDCPAAGTVVVARVASSHARAQEIRVSQCSLYSKLVCVIMQVCEEEAEGKGICDTKLHLSEFFTYKGRENQYLLKSSEMRCWSLGYVNFCSSDPLCDCNYAFYQNPFYDLCYWISVKIQWSLHMYIKCLSWPASKIP